MEQEQGGCRGGGGEGTSGAASVTFPLYSSARGTTKERGQLEGALGASLGGEEGGARLPHRPLSRRSRWPQRGLGGGRGAGGDCRPQGGVWAAEARVLSRGGGWPRCPDDPAAQAGWLRDWAQGPGAGVGARSQRGQSDAASSGGSPGEALAAAGEALPAWTFCLEADADTAWLPHLPSTTCSLWGREGEGGEGRGSSRRGVLWPLSTAKVQGSRGRAGTHTSSSDMVGGWFLQGWREARARVRNCLDLEGLEWLGDGPLEWGCRGTSINRGLGPTLRPWAGRLLRLGPPQQAALLPPRLQAPQPSSPLI